MTQSASAVHEVLQALAEAQTSEPGHAPAVGGVHAPAPLHVNEPVSVAMLHAGPAQVIPALA